MSTEPPLYTDDFPPSYEIIFRTHDIINSPLPPNYQVKNVLKIFVSFLIFIFNNSLSLYYLIIGSLYFKDDCEYMLQTYMVVSSCTSFLGYFIYLIRSFLDKTAYIKNKKNKLEYKRKWYESIISLFNISWFLMGASYSFMIFQLDSHICPNIVFWSVFYISIIELSIIGFMLTFICLCLPCILSSQ